MRILIQSIIILLFINTAWSGEKITGNLQVTGLGGSGVACIHTDNSGNISVTNADCGTGSGGAVNWNNIGGIQASVGVSGFNWQSASQVVQSYNVNWADTNSYKTINSSGINWNNINGIGPINEGGINWTNFPVSGFAKWNANSAPTADTNTYLTGNQSITVTHTGQVTGSGSGATSISVADTINWAAITALIPSASVNWDNVNGLAPIHTGGINWNAINDGVGRALTRTATGVNWTDFPSGGSGTVTSIATSNGVTGGTITTTGTISGVNAAADGSTKGVAAFTATDFTASSGVISGMLTKVGTASPSAASSFTFSSLSKTKKYMLLVDLKNSNNNYLPQITFNGDTGNNYNWGQMINGGATVSNSKATAQANILPGLNGSPANGYAQFTCFFNAVTDDGHKTLITCTSTQYDNVNNYVSSVMGGVYLGSADLTSITWTASNNTFTGAAELYTIN